MISCYEISICSNPLGHIPLRLPLSFGYDGKSQNILSLKVNQKYVPNYVILVLKFQNFLTSLNVSRSMHKIVWFVFRKFPNFLTPEGRAYSLRHPLQRIWWRKPTYFSWFVLNVRQNYAQNYVISCFEISKFSNPLMGHILLRHPFHLDMMGKVKIFFQVSVTC